MAPHFGSLKVLLELFDEHGLGPEEVKRLTDNPEILVRIGKGEFNCETLNKRGLQFPAQTRRFQLPGVLDAVKALGGQFAEAEMTVVPAGETLKSQKDNKVIKRCPDWLFLPEKEDRPTIGSEVIYLPNVVEGSRNCTYKKVRGLLAVQDILTGLPKVNGLWWIVGNVARVSWILDYHLRETGRYLLSGDYTWTTDIYERPFYGNSQLIVGQFYPHGISVSSLFASWHSDVGLFVLGVPI